MGNQHGQGYRIRPLRRADRPAVRHVCAATAWMGRPAPERIGSEWLWAEFWTRYFTDRQRQLGWVVQRPGGRSVVGYLTGTTDVRHFNAYVGWLLPRLAAGVVHRRLLRDPPARRAIGAMLRSVAAGELSLPPGLVWRHPATFHINLLPEARRRGLGSSLLEVFLVRLRLLGVPGLHAQTLSANEAVAGFCRRAGFRLVASGPIRAFAHVDGRPLEVHTWAMAL